MKKLNNYPVYEKYYLIFNWILDKLEKYPKSVRYSVCKKIYEITVYIYEKIIDSIYDNERLDALKQVNISIEKLRLFMRLSHDRKYISTKQYEYISEEINELGKMIGGWLKNCEK